VWFTHRGTARFNLCLRAYLCEGVSRQPIFQGISLEIGADLPHIRFLQTPESPVSLDENHAAHEQGLAVVLCLLSGLQVFQPSYPAHNRLCQVLQGFHGLHTYASEHWVQYLLSTAASEQGLMTASHFFTRSVEFADSLNSLSQVESVAEANTSDTRLAHLQRHNTLLRVAKNILSASVAVKPSAGIASNDSALAHNASLVSSTSPSTTDLSKITDLASLLINYQRTISTLLLTRTFPGFSIPRLEKFKNDFRSAVHTCRFKYCPLGQTGFESEQLRDEHEKAHSPGILCKVPGCSYPAFPTTQKLRSHHAKHHQREAPRIRIKSTPAPRNDRSRGDDIVFTGKHRQIEQDLIHSTMTEVLEPRDPARPKHFIDLTSDDLELQVPDSSIFQHLPKSPPSAEQIDRLKIYQLRNNDWSDVGTGRFRFLHGPHNIIVEAVSPLLPSMHPSIILTNQGRDAQSLCPEPPTSISVLSDEDLTEVLMSTIIRSSKGFMRQHGIVHSEVIDK
jgi:hypothetical protein